MDFGVNYFESITIGLIRIIRGQIITAVSKNQ